MTRWLAVVGLLGTIGCGVAPGGESEQALGSVCPSGYFPITSTVIASSASDPWGQHTGTVVIYGTSPSLTIYGVDWSTANTIDWVMVGASDTDVAKFESYPQSRRDCSGSTGNVSGGASPKTPPDPEFHGLCVPSTIWTDAAESYSYGPYDDNNAGYCRYLGAGGCVPLTCAQTGGCGYQTNGCGGTNYCGACTHCPCGGTYPHCYVCSTF